MIQAANDVAPDEPVEAMLMSWLDAEGSARLLVDDYLRISWANATARHWIDNRWPIAAVNERLCLGGSSLALRALLGRVGRAAAGTCIPAIDGASHLIVCARRIEIDGIVLFGIRIRRTDCAPVETPIGAAEAFRLTASESRVMDHLCRGSTAQETATDLTLSVETVRTHIKRLYQKVGVNSREALLNQLRPFMIRL